VGEAQLMPVGCQCTPWRCLRGLEDCTAHRTPRRQQPLAHHHKTATPLVAERTIAHILPHSTHHHTQCNCVTHPGCLHHIAPVAAAAAVASPSSVADVGLKDAPLPSLFPAELPPPAPVSSRLSTSCC
jgi:hypothetical protein